MTKRVGIIPAGGNAVRFGGALKELLPLNRADCGLSRCADAMRPAELLLFSNKKKAQIHREIVPDATIITEPQADLWEVVYTAAATTFADWYLFAMPDTVFPLDVFQQDIISSTMVGVFDTKKTGRFGIFVDNLRIIDKPDFGGMAWGVWAWSYEAMKTLSQACRQYKNLTKALNVMLERHGVEMRELEYYYDFAAMEDYTEFLCHQNV